MERTEAHIEARLIAERKGEVPETYLRKAIKNGIFINHGTKKPYSYSWVYDQLKKNNMNIVDKLREYSV